MQYFFSSSSVLLLPSPFLPLYLLPPLPPSPSTSFHIFLFPPLPPSPLSLPLQVYHPLPPLQLYLPSPLPPFLLFLLSLPPPLTYYLPSLLSVPPSSSLPPFPPSFLYLASSQMRHETGSVWNFRSFIHNERVGTICSREA